MNDSEFESIEYQNHLRAFSRMYATSVPFQNDSNVLALNYPQCHGKGHFKEIAK
jgi:hypothetical protein